MVTWQAYAHNHSCRGYWTVVPTDPETEFQSQGLTFLTTNSNTAIQVSTYTPIMKLQSLVRCDSSEVFEGVIPASSAFPLNDALSWAGDARVWVQIANKETRVCQRSWEPELESRWVGTFPSHARCLSLCGSFALKAFCLWEGIGRICSSSWFVSSSLCNFWYTVLFHSIRQ